MSMKQISVFVENKPGALYALTAVLAQGQIDMRALSLAETKRLRHRPHHRQRPVQGHHPAQGRGLCPQPHPCGGGGHPRRARRLNRVLQVLTDAKVNVEYMYAFLGGKDVDHAYMIFRVADDKAAETALASRGIQVLDQEQVERL